MVSPVEQARVAFASQLWREACGQFADAAAGEQLGVGDHERFAVACDLIGDDERCEHEWEAAHRAAIGADDPASAARCAVLLALCLVLRGQMARAGGWLARAEGLLDELGTACPASGYVLVPKVVGALGAGEAATARDLSMQATDLGRQFVDADLRTLGVLGEGQALLALGDAAAGGARLDEAMVAVTAGEVGPVVSGIVYCAAIIECLRRFEADRRRAHHQPAHRRPPRGSIYAKLGVTSRAAATAYAYEHDLVAKPSPR